MTKKVVTPPLLALLEPKQVPTYELVIEPIPQGMSLAPNRVWIASVRKVGNEVVAKYRIPVQWTQDEASVLVEMIRRVGWQLKEGEIYEGRPYCNDEVDFVCEQFCRQQIRINQEQEEVA
jgi:hypothetical protein